MPTLTCKATFRQRQIAVGVISPEWSVRDNSGNGLADRLVDNRTGDVVNTSIPVLEAAGSGNGSQWNRAATGESILIEDCHFDRLREIRTLRPKPITIFQGGDSLATRQMRPDISGRMFELKWLNRVQRQRMGGAYLVYLRMAYKRTLNTTAEISSPTPGAPTPDCDYLTKWAAHYGVHMLGTTAYGYDFGEQHQGEATSADTGPATTLTAAGAAFDDFKNPVRVHWIVRNETTGASGFVVSVDGPGVITHTELTGGSRQDWQIGDSYSVNGAELNWGERTYCLADRSLIGGTLQGLRYGVKDGHAQYISLQRGRVTFVGNIIANTDATALQHTARASNSGDNGIPGFGRLYYDSNYLRDCAVDNQGHPISLKGRHSGVIFIRDTWIEGGHDPRLTQRWNDGTSGGIVIDHRPAFNEAYKIPIRHPNSEVVMSRCIIVVGGRFTGNSTGRREAIYLESGGARRFTLDRSTVVRYGRAVSFRLHAVDYAGWLTAEEMVDTTEFIRLDRDNLVLGVCTYLDRRLLEEQNAWDDWEPPGSFRPTDYELDFQDPNMDGQGYRDLLAYLQANVAPDPDRPIVEIYSSSGDDDTGELYGFGRAQATGSGNFTLHGRGGATSTGQGTLGELLSGLGESEATGSGTLSGGSGANNLFGLGIAVTTGSLSAALFGTGRARATGVGTLTQYERGGNAPQLSPRGQAVDFEIVEQPSGEFDFAIETDGSMTHEDSMATEVLTSLMSDSRALPGDSPFVGQDRRGWWADAEFGSRVWIPLERALSASSPADAEVRAKEGLQWLIDDGVVERVDVSAEIDARDRASLQMRVKLVRGSATRAADLWRHTLEAATSRRLSSTVQIEAS